MERKVKVRLVQAAVQRPRRQKTRFASNWSGFSATSSESWLVWIRKFKSIAALNKWSPELQCQILHAYLKGLAEQTYYCLTAEQTATLTAVEHALTDRFHPKESRQVHISTLRQGSYKKLQPFFKDFSRTFQGPH